MAGSRPHADGRDAFVTTAQESAYAVAVQRAEMHGPPMYDTVERGKARDSAMRLAKLEPEVVLTGHGVPMRGSEMRAALHQLIAGFDWMAVPTSGRCVRVPAQAEDGSAYCDPKS